MDKATRNIEVQNAIALMHTGIGDKEIAKRLAKKYPMLRNNFVNGIVKSATQQIASKHFVDAETIIPLHLHRYNEQINSLLKTKDADDLITECDEELHFDSKTYYQLRNKKIKAFSDCLDTMRLKEELLQLHDTNFTLNLNSEERVIIKDQKPQINLDKLTFEEQLELYELLKKCRKDISEVIAVKPNSQVAEDTTAIEVNLNIEPNINLIKTEISKEELIPERTEHPTKKLQRALLLEAVNKMKNAGARLTEEEKEIIQDRNVKSQQN